MRTAIAKLVQSIALGLALFSGWAWAHGPSMADIYAAAQAGQMDKAQSMIQQVLINHPNSAKAHYVRAELYAREGNYARARESLAQAERIAPGLPFAKPTSITELKTQITQGSGAHSMQPAPSAPVNETSLLGWLLPLALVIGVLAWGYALFRRQRPQPPYAAAGGHPTGYGPAPGYSAAYPPQDSGLGSKVVGGLATGLAVGAGVVAAEAIGRRLLGDHEQSTTTATHESYAPPASNADMGGDNFGVQDTSWDDGGGSAGGSSWDN